MIRNTKKYKNTNKKVDLVYPRLSFKVVGCLFAVYKKIGGGHRESYYQKAVKEELLHQKIKFKEQLYAPLIYRNKTIGKNFIDFLIEDKIVLEIKRGPYFKKCHLEQVLDYLKNYRLKLGIIGNFTQNGVEFYRVVNIK